MSRREKLERKLEKRQQWAGSAKAESNAKMNRAQQIGERFAGGQPIILNHHSTARALKDRERMDDAMRGSIEANSRAEHHSSKAEGIARQLKTTIFSDDDDALERLRAKLKQQETEHSEIKRVNKAFRKSGVDGVVALGYTKDAVEGMLNRSALVAEKTPYAKFRLTNLGAEIRRTKKRIEEVAARQAQLAKAEAAGGVLVEHFPTVGKSRVTFTEKPEYPVIQSLKAAGYQWSDPSWVGPTEALPEGLEGDASGS